MKCLFIAFCIACSLQPVVCSLLMILCFLFIMTRREIQINSAEKGKNKSLKSSN